METFAKLRTESDLQADTIWPTALFDPVFAALRLRDRSVSAES
jgi:hypothetical protein